jgi:DNA invertase Pin-like site-specific DNA recombinase
MNIVNVYSYVRWSSDKQTWGDSERRQEQMAKDWCERQRLKLSSLSFKDQGTSAWKGRNLQDGALAELLSVVRPGMNLWKSRTSPS